MAYVPPHVILIALSGIQSRDDVLAYDSLGVTAVLVGESLMRAENVPVFIAELLGRVLQPRRPTLNFNNGLYLNLNSGLPFKKYSRD